MKQQALDEYRSRLQSRLASLQDQATIQRAAGDVVELDQTRTGRLTRMDAMQQQAMANANRERTAIEKQQIHAALQRIESGHFGVCTECGEDIARARLDARPTVTRCIHCAAQHDNA